MNYSIWIIPPEPIFDKLSDIIKRLSVKYKSHFFTPHMTVLGSIDRDLDKIKKVAEKITVDMSPIKLFLGPVSFSTTYFQSVFVRINSTVKLMQLNLTLKKLLKIENSVFMPHISLLYGKHDMVTRGKISEQIILDNTTFVAHKLCIIPEKIEPSEWKPIVTIPFGING